MTLRSLRLSSIFGSKLSVRPNRGPAPFRYSKILGSRPSSRPGKRPQTLIYSTILGSKPSSSPGRRPVTLSYNNILGSRPSLRPVRRSMTLKIVPLNLLTIRAAHTKPISIHICTIQHDPPLPHPHSKLAVKSNFPHHPLPARHFH